MVLLLLLLLAWWCCWCCAVSGAGAGSGAAAAAVAQLLVRVFVTVILYCYCSCSCWLWRLGALRELWKFVLLGLVSKCNLADTTWPNEVEYSSLTGNVNFVAWRLEEAGVDQWNIFLRQRWCEHCQLVPMIPLKRLTTQRPLYTLHVACPILTSSGSDKQWAGNFFGNIQNWESASVCLHAIAQTAFTQVDFLATFYVWLPA